MADSFDVVIVGGGPAGEHAAGRARAEGLSVALVEAHLVGGECSYYACMPSKTLLRPGHVLADARAVPGAAEAVSGSIDVTAALGRRDWMVSSYDDGGQVDWLDGVGAELVRGRGRLGGEREVVVELPGGGERRLSARRAVLLAVGSAPAVPPIPGLAQARYWTNREATAAKTVPERLLVLGGGVVGVELAQAFRRLGSREVTIVEAGARVLATMDPFVAELVGEAFEREGIGVRTGAAAIEVGQREGGEITLVLEGGEHLVGDELLVAVGRRPATGDLGLEVVGLEGGKAIAVDASMRAAGVAGAWLYVVGDANGRALLTHMGKYQARVAIDAIVNGPADWHLDESVVPAVVFTDPEIGTVGLSEQHARQTNRAVRVIAVDLSAVAAAPIWGDGLIGRAQLVVDEERGVPVGATFVGPEMGAAIHAATVAIVGEVPMTRLRHAVASFPTMSEIWLELVNAYFTR